MSLIVVKFLQNPGLNLRAAVGEGDPVEIVFNYRFGFRSRLLVALSGAPGYRCGRGWTRCNISELVGLLIRLPILR